MDIHIKMHHIQSQCSVESMERADEEASPWTSKPKSTWNMCGQPISRSAIVFLCQVIILYISIITCFINLTISNGPTELWISLLSLSLGSILPSPKVKKPWPDTQSIGTSTTNSLV